MADFEEEKCPVCQAILFSDDDIVVCPECGTPHHRECYAGLGRCANADKHGTNWKYVKQAGRTDGESFHGGENPGSGKKCPNCGNISSSVTIFCPYCGYQFGHSGPQGASGAGGMPFGYAGRIIDPMGGVDPRTDIDGVPAAELMPFVAVNTQRYIPKFADMSAKGKVLSWNWAAFFLRGFWLIYRKCYKEGIAALVLMIAASLLSFPVNIVTNDLIETLPETYTYADVIGVIMGNISAYTPGVVICFLLSILLSVGIMVFFGLFGDYLYKRRCVASVSKIRQKSSAEEKHVAMTKGGGVNFIFPIIAYFVYDTVISIISVFIL